MLRIAAATFALALAAVGCGERAPTTAFDGAVYPPGARAPGFALPSLSDGAVSLGAERGHVVALVFLPGDCRTCVLVAQQIRGALDELSDPRDVRVIFVSTAPRSDSTAQAQAFLAKTALLGRASYLLASEARLRPTWRAYHVTPPRTAGRKAAEDAITVLLIDKSGVERVGFGIEQITPAALAHDIRLLQAG